MKTKQELQSRRQRRVRAKIVGTERMPRLSVFRSASHIYGQLIDDENKRTLLSCSDIELKTAKKTKKSDAAFEVGKQLAKKSLALTKKVERVIFDRGRYKYHGRVKALADGAREGGLKF